MDQQIFRRTTFAVILCSSYPMLVVGCYFGLIPWNMERLQIDESDLGFAILFFGISFLISNQIAGRILVPIIIRQAFKYTSESIPTTVTNLITMGFSALLFAPAIIGFVAETFSLTINMYALCIIVFFAGNILLRKFT